MDIQAYLDRIGYTGSRDLTAQNLSRLIRCHLETVPFENLDSHPNGFPLDNDPEVLFDKVVTRRRGGVCFELNGLFYELLSALGYDCYPVEVRLHMVGRPASPISHEGVLVRVDGRKYYCDVGYGGPGPKDIMPVDTEEEQLIYGQRYRIRHSTHQVHLQRLSDGEWIKMISYTDSPCIPQDFTGRLFYFGMHPKSRFVTQRIANLCLPCGGSKALTNNHLTIRRNGEVLERDLETEEEITQVLLEEFGIRL